MYRLVLSSKFQKQLRRIIRRNSKLRIRIVEVLNLIRVDIRHPSLKLHKLKGENNWSFSMTRKIRIIAHLEKKKIYLLRIGDHDEVY